MNTLQSPSPYPPPPAPAFAFVLHDAGETRALLPVMQKLGTAGVDYVVVAESTARTLLQGDPHLAPNPQEITATERTNPALAAEMKQQLDRLIQAQVCVTGLVSSFQKQWADFFRQSGRRVVGYYEGFSFPANPVKNRANAFQGSLTDLMTATEGSAAYFRRQGFENIPVSVVGQPTLESMPRVTQGTDPALLANELLLMPNEPVILFVGQYGPEYEQALSLFCQTASQLSGANLLVSLHPQTSGDFERSMLQQAGLLDRIQLVPKSVSTAQALAVANVTLAHSSTVATQAFLQGKKVIFVGNQDSDVCNPLEARGLASRCVTPNALTASVNQALQTFPSQPTLSTESLYQLLGIPMQATSRITAYLLNVLKEQSIAAPQPES
jgi:hypothetical protein